MCIMQCCIIDLIQNDWNLKNGGVSSGMYYSAVEVSNQADLQTGMSLYTWDVNKQFNVLILFTASLTDSDLPVVF